MKHHGAFPPLVAGLVVAAVLVTLLVSGGWLIWVPVGLALAVVSKVWHILGR